LIGVSDIGRLDGGFAAFGATLVALHAQLIFCAGREIADA